MLLCVVLVAVASADVVADAVDVVADVAGVVDAADVVVDGNRMCKYFAH